MPSGRWRSRGHEIACHGYEYENFGLLEYDEQKERIGKAVEAIEKACGQKARRLPGPHRRFDAQDPGYRPGIRHDLFQRPL